MTRAGTLLLAALCVACYPTTTRPHLVPQPGSSVMELELFMPEATRELALALDADSIPVRRTEARDGWLESEWFDARTMRPTKAWPVGPDIVKVRAFVDPGRPNHSVITIETVYRPVADPSRPGRDLERQVPVDHPVALKVAAIVNRLTQQHTAPADEDDVAVPVPAVPAPRDTTTPSRPTSP